MSKVKEIARPVYLKVTIGDSTVITLGSISQVCSNFDVSVPDKREYIPLLISHRLKDAKAELITADQFRRLNCMIADSKGAIKLV